MTTAKSRLVLAMVLALVFTGALAARTITISADDCDRMAVISAAAPRLGWCNEIGGTGRHFTWGQLHLYSNMAILIRYPLDRIPKGQRITKAEWTVPSTYTGTRKQRLSVSRILAEWGTGVCHDYRMVLPPKKLEWDRPGGMAVNVDRAAKTTAVFTMLNAGTSTVDVTEDIELWYTGAVPNRGWILNLDDGGVIFMPAPYPTGADWKLQITYEPK